MCKICTYHYSWCDEGLGSLLMLLRTAGGFGAQQKMKCCAANVAVMVGVKISDV